MSPVNYRVKINFTFLVEADSGEEAADYAVSVVEEFASMLEGDFVSYEEASVNLESVEQDDEDNLDG